MEALWLVAQELDISGAVPGQGDYGHLSPQRRAEPTLDGSRAAHPLGWH
jgi:hypothetical protein